MSRSRLVRAAPPAWAQAPASGFPDASSTGASLPGGLTMVGTGHVTSGPGWTWNSSSGLANISTANTTFSGYQVLGGVNVTASGVTVQNSSISDGVLTSGAGTTIGNCVILSGGGGGSIGINLEPASTGTTITNCTISGTDSAVNRVGYAIYANTTDPSLVVTGCNVFWMRIGITVPGTGGYTVTGNYFHDFGYGGPSDHSEGIYVPGNAPGLISGNSILNQLDQTAAIIIQNLFGVVGNATITGNLLAGGDYVFYGGGDPASTFGMATGVTFTGNSFSAAFYTHGGAIGPAADWSVPGNTWSGNTWIDGSLTGQTIPHP